METPALEGSAAVNTSPPTVMIFIVADIASFILFFAVFMLERLNDPAAFARSAALLDVRVGLLNTLVLVTSGLLVALALAAHRADRTTRARRLTAAAALLGGCFVALKTWEYAAKFAEGLGITTDPFFGFYYVLTGVHLVHVLVGLVVLISMMSWLRSGQGAPGMHARIEGGALYWHMVDLLWIFLFPLLYLQTS